MSMNRRDWLRASAFGLTSVGWLGRLAAETGGKPKRNCILLWMAGGPSQTDTFDPKPGHANAGPFKVIDTAVPGIKIGEHLPKVAARMNHLAVVRSMATKEGDHGRATLHLRTGVLPQGSIQFPTFGSLVSNEHDRRDSDLPNYVSISPRGIGGTALSPGFLGPKHAPLVVGRQGGDADLRIENIDRPPSVTRSRANERLELMRDLESDFLTKRPGVATGSHQSAYDRAVRLMRESAARAFNLNEEKEALRDAYGRNGFGQGCLLARRLVERGVPFVEVTLDGWDTHDNNFKQVESLCGTLDPAWATLIDDLKDRGLLDSTLIVWMGEFGRTPGINPRNGRDHYPNAWSIVLGGGGIRGGAVVGRTSDDGLHVKDRPVSVPDLLATVCLALGIDPTKQNMSNVGRPIRIVEPGAKPLNEVLS